MKQKQMIILTSLIVLIFIGILFVPKLLKGTESESDVQPPSTNFIEQVEEQQQMSAEKSTEPSGELSIGETQAELASHTLNRDPIVYEAEKAKLNGTTVNSTAEGFSGTGYVAGFDEDNDSVTFTVKAQANVLYNLSIGFRAPNGDKVMSLELNGKPSGEVSVRGTKEFKEVSAGKVLLNKGDNTIAIVKNWGWYEIDYIKLQIADAPAAHQIVNKLVNPNATAGAKSLMSFLVDNYGKFILSGQQEYKNIEWLEKNVGKKPAVMGFDLIDYSPSRVKYGATSKETDLAIEWHKQGGIVTFAWHWNAPMDLINETGKEWWRGFYTDATTFDIQYAMDNEKSKQYRLLLDDIDVIAVQLKKLQKANVPVLFRPLHEAEGGWFWWGAKGPEPAKKLYKLVYDRLTNYHKLNNLIWVWNSVSPDWYPGDDVVDIVSYDSYPKDGDYGPVIQQYDSLVKLVKDKKIVALSENGSIPDPDLLSTYGADWSWFCTWTGEFLTDGKKNSLEHLKKLYNHKRVLTLDELPDLTKYGQ